MAPPLLACDVIWLVRHGSREDHENLDWARAAARPHDPSLSPRGIIEARHTAMRLEAESIRHIFTSPYLRCAQTAQLIAERVQAPVHLEPGLGELNDPHWTTGAPLLLSRPELAKHVPLDDRHAPIVEPHYPETIPEAFARSERTARILVEHYEGPLLLVGHAVSILGIVRGLANHEHDSPCAPASVFRLERRHGSWHLALNGDTGHLPVAAAVV